MIEETYVSFETAKLLKEKGFDEPTHVYYDKDGDLLYSSFVENWNESKIKFSALTQAMAMGWLREEKNIFIQPSLSYTIDGSKAKYYVYILYANNGHSVFQYGKGIQYVNPLTQEDGNGPKIFDSPEAAVEAALKYTLENLI